MTDTREDARALIARLDAAAKGLRSFYKVGAVELIPAATMTEAAALIRAQLDELDATLKDRALILAERDRTFALMLARAEAAEARLADVEAERDGLRDALVDHNDILRSAMQIAKREGVDGLTSSTNWDAYYNRVAVVLKRHHATATASRAALSATTPLPETVLPRAWSDLISDAIAEAEKAMRKFPQPNYVITKLAEEAGEVVKAAVHCAEGRETAENLRGEMKQCIAMLYRLWVEGDQVHGLASVRDALTATPANEGETP